MTYVEVEPEEGALLRGLVFGALSGLPMLGPDGESYSVTDKGLEVLVGVYDKLELVPLP